MKILIKGYYGRRNFGDDALLYSVLEALKYKKCSLYIEEKSHSHYIDDMGAVNVWDENMDMDVILHAGGTQFFSFGKASVREKLEYWVDYFERKPLLAAKELCDALLRKITKDTKVSRVTSKDALRLAIGIGIGYVRDPDYRKSLINQLNSFNSICPRDSYTLDFLRENVSDRVSLTPGADLCYKGFEDAVKKINAKKIKKRIGVILRDFKWIDDEKLNGFIISESMSLVADGYEVVFYALSEEEDTKYIRMAERQGQNLKVWSVSEGVNFSEYIEEIGRCERIITSRYHGAVFASLLKIPHLLVGIDKKMDEHHSEIESISRIWKLEDVMSRDCKAMRSFLSESFSEKYELLDSELEMLIDRSEKNYQVIEELFE